MKEREKRVRREILSRKRKKEERMMKYSDSNRRETGFAKQLFAALLEFIPSSETFHLSPFPYFMQSHYPHPNTLLRCRTCLVSSFQDLFHQICYYYSVV